jgi:hypothetical protein
MIVLPSLAQHLNEEFAVDDRVPGDVAGAGEGFNRAFARSEFLIAGRQTGMRPLQTTTRAEVP